MMKFIIYTLIALILFVDYCILKVASNVSRIEEKMINDEIKK